MKESSFICHITDTVVRTMNGNNCGTSVHQINFTVCNRLLVTVSVRHFAATTRSLSTVFELVIQDLQTLYLLKVGIQPVCESCHSPLTVKHIFVDCTRYSAARQRYFGVDTLWDVFENVTSRNIIACLLYTSDAADE